VRVIDLETGRQIVRYDDTAELRLGFGDLQQHHKPGVLLDLRGIDRVAVGV